MFGHLAIRGSVQGLYATLRQARTPSVPRGSFALGVRYKDQGMQAAQIPLDIAAAALFVWGRRQCKQFRIPELEPRDHRAINALEMYTLRKK